MGAKNDYVITVGFVWRPDNKLIYCFYVGELVSSVHFELNCNIWGFEACLRSVTGNRNRLTVQQGANSFAVFMVEIQLVVQFEKLTVATYFTSK